MGDESEFYQNIFSSLIDGIIIVSPEGNISLINLAVEEMFLQSRENIVNNPVTDLFPDQPDVEGKILTTLKTGKSFRDVECRGFRKINSTHFPVNLLMSPFHDPEGKVQGVLLHVRDMSLLKELKETSRQMDQMSTLAVISLGMAHEIKNPLGAIGGSAQLLRRKIQDSEQKEFLDVVIKEVGRLNRMVDRMLGFANPGKLKIKKFNIHKALDDILVLEKKSLNDSIIFKQSYDPSLPYIEADEDQLKQVFLNLIRNAVEAMPLGGKIKLVTRISSDYTIKTSGQPTPRQDIIVEIIDSGPGIEEEQMKNLFTPFHTTKSKGSGLGLPISLKIVENHKGTIKIISGKNKGTSIQVFLPLKQ